MESATLKQSILIGRLMTSVLSLCTLHWQKLLVDSRVDRKNTLLLRNVLTDSVAFGAMSGGDN